MSKRRVWYCYLCGRGLKSPAKLSKHLAEVHQT